VSDPDCTCSGWACPHRPIYTREDLIRVVLGQQWAVAICLMENPPHYHPMSTHRIGDLPCAVDVVDGKS
jgi:hypothetical protein